MFKAGAACYNRITMIKGYMEGRQVAEKKAPGRGAAKKSGDERKAALEYAISRIEKDFGKGSVMKLGDAGKTQVEVIPTGCLSWTLRLESRAAQGRIHRNLRPRPRERPHCASLRGGGQKRAACRLIDAEHALDPTYAKPLGDTENLMCPSPTTRAGP